MKVEDLLEASEIVLSFEEETFSSLKEVYEKLYHYKNLSRNPSTAYANNKFSECFESWKKAMKEARRKHGYNEAQKIIDRVIEYFEDK